MSDNKWTPEPWPFYHEINAQLKDFAILTNVDYSRCRECVNALAGEKDPAQFVGMGKNYINEDRLIRKLINADENERTYDEVERLMNQREELAEQVDLLQKGLESCLNQREELADQVNKLNESLNMARNYIKLNLK